MSLDKHLGRIKSRDSRRENSEDTTDVEEKIATEMEGLKSNIEGLQSDVEQKKLDKEYDKEGINKLGSSVKKLIIGIGVLLAIPVVASLISPDISQKISELNDMAHAFVDENPSVLWGFLGTVTTIYFALIAPAIYEGIKDGTLFKDPMDKE